MTRCEEVPHIRSLFRQFGSDEEKKLNLINVIREVALHYLPPDFSDETRATFEKNAAITKSEKYASSLWYLCTEAIEEQNLSDQLQLWILDAYMCLDVDGIESFMETLKNELEKVNEKHANSLDKMAGQFKADYEEALTKAEAPLKAKITQLFGAQAKMKSIIEAHKISTEIAS
ncbi:MAG: hypothetical protein Q8L02_06240 [Candidatus Nitrotoga sp.]|nr:hypothetical protein [Candidatus Nitrotoga sp.]